MKAQARPTGQEMLDWLDAHADQFGPFTSWQREIVLLWGDGWSYSTTAKRWGVATARRAFITAHRALAGGPAEPTPVELRSGASMGRGIVWSELAEQMEREARGGRVP